MDTEKLKPFNEFNSEKSAIVNEICYRLFNEQNNEQNNNFFKELKKIQIPTQIPANGQYIMSIGTAAEYENTGIVPILFETGTNALAFGRSTGGGKINLLIKNTSNTPLQPGGVLYLLIMEVK